MGGGEILRFHWAERAIAAALLYCRLLYGRMSVISRSSHVITCMCWAGLGGEGLLDSGFWAAPAAVERARSIERRPAPQAQAGRPAAYKRRCRPHQSTKRTTRTARHTYIRGRACARARRAAPFCPELLRAGRQDNARHRHGQPTPRLLRQHRSVGAT
jgi:hypothetical protein